MTDSGSWPPNGILVIQSELKEGSPELTHIFERELVGANDTSAAVGYAPLKETERLVLAAEQWLISPDFQRRFPEAGEDVKVMGVRRDRDLTLTVALAFVDRFVLDARSYFERKTVPAPIREPTWAVYRQDDNGNGFVVATRLSREEAERLVAEFEARGHKQVYWAEPEQT